MLFYCAYTWHPHTTIAQVHARHDQQFQANALHFEKVRGFYDFAGGGAGFVLIDATTPQEVTDILRPYLDLMSWDVRAVIETDIAEFRTWLQHRAGGTSA